ncbi:unnamed protein product [Dicrocoelium dendriticum]|nr:unnamed protein product [Dicrocoelium dendriticum]
MASHRTRMQYEQQKQAGVFGRNDSQSSLKSDDPLNTPSGSSLRGPVHRSGDLSSSVLSGSYSSSRPRAQLSGAAAAVARNYENLPESSRPGSASSTLNMTPRTQRDFGARPGSVLSYQPSTVVGKSVVSGRSVYSVSQLRVSRSLKASRASLATYKSGRTTIQAEHHDRKVQRELNSVKFGRARKLYWISVASFMMFLLVLFLGLLVTCLRFIYMNIILSLDVGEMVGPLLIACSFLFFGLGLKFYCDAYRLGCEERARVKYKAASPSTVAVTTVSEREIDTE